MIYIFHGEGTAVSRKLLSDATDEEKALGHDIRVLEGDKLAPRDLESILATSSLFTTESLVIENLLSRLRSKDKDACLDILSNYSGEKNIYLWDKKEITKPNLAKLSSAKVSNSKAPTELFALLESLIPGNLKTAHELMQKVFEGTEEIIVFTMIARQISYLIMIKSGTSPKFAPWQIGKLKSQASKWDDKTLEIWISELLRIDYAIKSGKTKLSYGDHLDLLLATLLR